MRPPRVRGPGRAVGGGGRAVSIPLVIDASRPPDAYDAYRDLELHAVRSRRGWLATRHGDGTLTAYRTCDDVTVGPDTPERLLQAMAAADDTLRAPLCRFLPGWTITWMDSHGMWLAVRREQNLTITSSSRRRLSEWAPTLDEMADLLSAQAEADADEIVDQAADDLDAADAADVIGAGVSPRFGGVMGEPGSGSGEPPGDDPGDDSAADPAADPLADLGEQQEPALHMEMPQWMLARLADAPETMTPREVAIMFRASVRSVMRWGKAGWGGLFFTLGGLPRFRRDRIIATAVVVDPASADTSARPDGNGAAGPAEGPANGPDGAQGATETADPAQGEATGPPPGGDDERGEASA